MAGTPQTGTGIRAVQSARSPWNLPLSVPPAMPAYSSSPIAHMWRVGEVLTKLTRIFTTEMIYTSIAIELITLLSVSSRRTTNSITFSTLWWKSDGNPNTHDHDGEAALPNLPSFPGNDVPQQALYQIGPNFIMSVKSLRRNFWRKVTTIGFVALVLPPGSNYVQQMASVSEFDGELGK